MSSGSRLALRYPAAERLPLVETLHGQQVSDPYRWLEDAGSAQTARWQDEQDELYRQARQDWTQRDRFTALVTELASVGYLSTPRAAGDRLFYTRMGAGRDHPALVVSEAGLERPLLDPDLLDPSGRTVLDSWEPSWEGERVVLQLSAGGTEDSVLWVQDVATGELIDGPIDRVRHSTIGWLPGGEAFYYVRRLPPELNPGEERYHRRVYLHRVGTPAEQDVLIFGTGRDKTQFYGVSVSPAGPWLLLTAAAGTSLRRDLWVAEVAGAAAANPDLRPMQVGLDARSTGYLPASSVASRRLYLRTDRDAPRGRIMVADLDDPSADWIELIAEDPGAVLDDFAVLDDPALERPLAVLSWRRHAVSELSVHELATGCRLAAIELPGQGVAGRLSADGHQLRFGYADPKTPPTVLSYQAGTGLTELWQAPAAPRADPAISSRLVSYHSADGTEVRMFVLAPTAEPDRPRPTILTGYGGFGSVLAPQYRPEALAWVRAGGVYALACLRGGSEEGADWHRAGTGAAKQNVFDDFAAAADRLVSGGWTRPDLLGIIGASNGGLLVGAAITQHPDKYAAAVCMAPLLDMVRYELSGMGPSWRPEYGSAADPEQFGHLLRYSPYHAVREQTGYPAVLLAVFDGDTRVDLSHARKMCAALQHASSGDGSILLRTERGVGHGARAVSSGIGLLADCLAFFAHQ
ncbi:MAG: prolyl oligopeptidase family serine peptidase, partial [Jatrophihabitantaceae bacterium]